MKHSPRSFSLSLAATLLATGALAASSVPGHQGQAAGCRSAAARGRASSDPRARSEAAVREEECLVQATDSVIPTLSRAAGESVDVPNAIQTHRDASASFCGVLAEKGAEIEGSGHPLAKAECVADRESELARLIDEYATGGQPPGAVITGYSTCDDAFKAGKSSVESWTALASCAETQLAAMVPSLVPKVADGDPLAVLSHPPEQIAMTFRAAVMAGHGVCDALVATPAPATPQRELLRLRCRAAVVANVGKAVGERLALSRAPLGAGARVGN
jgi:hypothetical protein